RQIKHAISIFSLKFQYQLIKVGWTFTDNAIGHMVIHKFPIEMNDVVNQITPDKEPTINVVFKHLRSNPISIFTDKDRKCRRTAHNKKFTCYTGAMCWMLHPHLRPAYFQKKGLKPESSVSSCHTSLSKSPHTFILDSG
ncbi:uncharacterized protein VP01_3770g2, partial [Puccinia sorghi]